MLGTGTRRGLRACCCFLLTFATFFWTVGLALFRRGRVASTSIGRGEPTSLLPAWSVSSGRYSLAAVDAVDDAGLDAGSDKAVLRFRGVFLPLMSFARLRRRGGSWAVSRSNCSSSSLNEVRSDSSPLSSSLSSSRPDTIDA